MDTLDYTGHISTTSGPNDIIKRPLESQDQLLYLTPPMLSIILTSLSATSQPLQNCQTLQQFLSPLYVTDLVSEIVCFGKGKRPKNMIDKQVQIAIMMCLIWDTPFALRVNSL
jgi:hypothetical protein